jgi:REP element-mobilizing transposase RayT
MPHPYTTYCPTFGYRGHYRYLLTFVTFDRTKAFVTAAVTLVLEQFLRTAGEQHFEILVYCFMPDHVHLVVEGTRFSDRNAGRWNG